MKARIQKWGNSLALRIPKSFAQELSIKEDTMIELTVEQDHLVVTVMPEERLVLADLVEKITSENRHQELLVDGPQGKELI